MAPKTEIQTRPARLLLPDGTETQATVQWEVFSAQSAGKRALQAWILSWGAAIAAVFIPLLHFILVPGLIITGPILFFVMSRARSRMLGGQGTCPACQAPFTIGAGQTSPRFYDLCTSCRREVTVELDRSQG